MTAYTTTLQALRDNHACERGYNLIANHVGRDFAGPIDLETILDNNGLDDAIWALRATEGGRELAIAFAIYCAEPYYTDPAWREWATNWMNGTDRTPASAERAANAAYAAYAAADAAYAAARAAYAAARAAYAAAYAASTARAAERTRQVEVFCKLVRGEAIA